ncbi:MAG: NAD-dependent deacetylase [Alphaproteobacteria bacterium]|nr:NAD-dependent deacetylase [Alphaproteobacteria bacterium]
MSLTTRQEAADRLRELVHGARRIVVFTGAGISTESGIPDFRSPGGLWTLNKPIDFSDFIVSEEMRRENWRRKIEVDKTMKIAEPNRGHLAVAALVSRGIASAVITQNVDGLHQKSGVPDEQVIELHGNSTYATCLDCNTRYELEAIKSAFEIDETLPTCTFCGGIIKQATISFGQAMPVEAMQRAQEATLDCDLFLTIGSSLVVYPAAGFPVLAKDNGSTLVILNRDATDLDTFADLVINDEIGPTLSDAVGLN